MAATQQALSKSRPYKTFNFKYTDVNVYFTPSTKCIQFAHNDIFTKLLDSQNSKTNKKNEHRFINITTVCEILSIAHEIVSKLKMGKKDIFERRILEDNFEKKCRKNLINDISSVQHEDYTCTSAILSISENDNQIVFIIKNENDKMIACLTTPEQHLLLKTMYYHYITCCISEVISQLLYK